MEAHTNVLITVYSQQREEPVMELLQRNPQTQVHRKQTKRALAVYGRVRPGLRGGCYGELGEQADDNILRSQFPGSKQLPTVPNANI